MPGPAAGSGIQQHIDRMARGRQMRLEKRSQQQQSAPMVHPQQQSPLMALADGPMDVFEARMDAYQRQSARRMLEDFAVSGIDEDLEHLKSGWATSFKHRPGMPQPQRPVPADLSSQRGRPRDALDWSLADDEDDEDEYDQPRSVLAAQGQRARQRLHGLDQLRKLADDDATDANDSIFFSRGNSSSSFAALADGRVSPATTRKSPAQTRPRRRTALSPFKSPAISSSSFADPWNDWERRWSQEFQFFEEAEHARLLRQRQAREAEEEEREAEWHRRVTAAKQEAEASSRWRPPRPERYQNQHSKAKGSSERSKDEEPHRKHSREYSSSSTGGGRPQQPPPVPPAAPPAPKVPAAPAFASFADFGKAWSSFEQKMQTAASSQKSPWLRCADIPWPTSLPAVSGASVGDDPAEKKKKLRSALMRWHPDKWAPILEQVVESERAQVMEQVKHVTQRILEEKKRFES